jgi:sugar/nucleoside kinase (ribokinase family)
MSLLVVGSIAFDSIETPFGKLDELLGGSATFFSAGASFFSPVRAVAVVGEDFDYNLLDFIKDRNVDLSGVYVEKGKTFRWGAKYQKDVNIRETIFTHLNVFQDFKPKIPEKFKESKCVFLANIDPDLQNEVLIQIKNPSLVVMDTMNFWIGGKRKSLLNVISNVDGIILNDSELRELSEEYNLIKAAKIVSKFGPELIIVKKGEHGAFIYYKGEFFFIPAFPLENVVDPTGAGDSFAGGFMGYIASSMKFGFEEFKNGIIFGTVIASFCVEKFGIERFKYLTRNEIDERKEEFLKMIRM